MGGKGRGEGGKGRVQTGSERRGRRRVEREADLELERRWEAAARDSARVRVRGCGPGFMG